MSSYCYYVCALIQLLYMSTAQMRNCADLSHCHLSLICCFFFPLRFFSHLVLTQTYLLKYCIFNCDRRYKNLFGRICGFIFGKDLWVRGHVSTETCMCSSDYMCPQHILIWLLHVLHFTRPCRNECICHGSISHLSVSRQKQENKGRKKNNFTGHKVVLFFMVSSTLH